MRWPTLGFGPSYFGGAADLRPLRPTADLAFTADRTFYGGRRLKTACVRSKGYEGIRILCPRYEPLRATRRCAVPKAGIVLNRYNMYN